MKLLNFSNLEFKWEEKKRIRFYLYYVDIKYETRYFHFYPTSYYFGNNLKIENWKADYRYWFINEFKLLKMNIANETS